MFEIGQVLTKGTDTKDVIWCNANNAHIDESGVNAYITFPKPFAQISTLLTTSCSSNRTTFLDNNIDVYNLSVVGFTKQYIANVGTGWSWRAEGYQD